MKVIELDPEHDSSGIEVRFGSWGAPLVSSKIGRRKRKVEDVDIDDDSSDVSFTEDALLFLIDVDSSVIPIRNKQVDLTRWLPLCYFSFLFSYQKFSFYIMIFIE